jgi:hypothetical protein
MKRPIILWIFLPLAIGCFSQTPLPPFENQTLAVEQFIEKHTREGKRGATIRDRRKELILTSSLDTEQTGKVTLWRTFTIGNSSIDVPCGFVLERGRIKKAEAADIRSIYRYLRDLNQVKDRP